jgi:hypothetical protein
MRDPFDAKLKNRESWFRIVLVLALAGVLVWRLAIADFSGMTFSFSELLSLLLALFSVAMSADIYFKATETSNVFYDNTYRFTKDISEIIGRMEAGFGERLKHLDEGYAGIRDSIARTPDEQKAAKKEIEVEKEAAKKIEKERESLLQQLADRAHLEAAEREKFFERFQATDRALKEARQDIAALKQRLAADLAASDHSPLRNTTRRRYAVTQYLSQPARLASLGLKPGQDSPEALREAFFNASAGWARQALKDMQLLGYVKAERQLTDRGVVWVQRVLSKEWQRVVTNDGKAA